MMSNDQIQQPLVNAFCEAREAARLRWASLKDVDALVNLYNLARDSKLENRETMTDWLEHGGGLILEDSKGSMLCAIRWREEREGWRVDRIATLPEARGLSYGRWLMTKLEALAIRRNIATLSLSLEDGHEDLLHYYQRMGYRPVQTGQEDRLLSKRVGGTWQYKSS